MRPSPTSPTSPTAAMKPGPSDPAAPDDESDDAVGDPAPAQDVDGPAAPASRVPPTGRRRARLRAPQAGAVVPDAGTDRSEDRDVSSATVAERTAPIPPKRGSFADRPRLRPTSQPATSASTSTVATGARRVTSVPRNDAASVDTTVHAHRTAAARDAVDSPAVRPPSPSDLPSWPMTPTRSGPPSPASALETIDDPLVERSVANRSVVPMARVPRGLRPVLDTTASRSVDTRPERLRPFADDLDAPIAAGFPDRAAWPPVDSEPPSVVLPRRLDESARDAPAAPVALAWSALLGTGPGGTPDRLHAEQRAR